MISTTSLSASSVDTPNMNLVFQVSNVTQGQFEFTTTHDVSLTEFLQLSVMVSSVQFVNNGSNDDAPTFAFNVTDGVITTATQPAAIFFNHKPKVKSGGELANQTVVAGEPFDFAVDLSIFEDPDNNTLSFTAQQSDLRPLPSTINFDNWTGYFSGTLDTVSLLGIMITAHDPRDLTVSTGFSLNVLSSQANIWMQVITPTALLSALTAIVGYSYRRYKMWSHRQHNAFADNLRVALNLDIYDFSTERGNDYNRAVERLIQEVNEKNQQFYQELAPQQVKIFASTVAAVIKDNYPQMVAPASCWIRFTNAMTCYGRRWVNRLDVAEFGFETAHISQKAVMAYKQIHSDQSTIAIEPTDSILDEKREDGDSIISQAKEPLLRSRSSVGPVDRVSNLEHRVQTLEQQIQVQTGRTLSSRVSKPSFFSLSGRSPSVQASPSTQINPSSRDSQKCIIL